MTKAKTPVKLLAFDAARYLDSEDAIAEYMTAVLEADDPDLLLLALGDVARAKGGRSRERRATIDAAP
jgi:probable addiction module antidote protein